MYRLILSISLGLLIAFGMGNFANASVPQDVMKPYKAYVMALKNGDEKAAYTNAKKAWQAAEKQMGNSKTTGDLANNFAELSEPGKNPYKTYKLRLKARKRAVDLANLYSEDEAPLIETERLLKLAETSLLISVWRHGEVKRGGSGMYFDGIERALKKYDLEGGTFEGDLEALKALFYNLRGSYEKSIEHADRSVLIYENRADDLPSAYPHMAALYKGDSLKKIGQPIQAVLEYQRVMQNLKGEVPSNHSFVETAFVKWMKTRSELEDSGQLDEAEKAGLCECWPFEDYKNKLTPLERIAPQTPRRFLEGSKSGHVQVMFDVNDQGEAINIRALSSTNAILEPASIAAVKKWKFTKKNPEEREEERRGITNKITFQLLSGSGTILPEPE